MQTNNATPQTPAVSVSVPYTLAQSAGNLNVVVVGWSDTTAQVASVTDTKGNAYRLAAGPTLLSGQLTQSIYFAPSIAAASAGANTVNVSFTVAAIFPDIRILEYAGLDPVSPVDVIASATGTSATSSTPAAATNNAVDLLFAANTVATTTAGAGAGWTSRVITFPDGNIAEDQVVSVAGSYGATAPLSAPGPWVMQMVAFKAGPSAPPPPPPSGGPIAFVQANNATPQTSVTGASVPYTSAQSAGNLNAVVVGWNDTTAQVASVTDTKGNTYRLAVGPTLLSGQLTQSIYYATNISAAAAGANTVNVSFTVAAAFADIRILEYAGLDAVSPVDVTASASGNGTTSSTPAAVTSNVSELLFAANTVTSWTTGPGSGWTSRVITNPDGDIAEDRTVAAAGSYDSTAPLGAAGGWVMQMVAFKAAPSGPPPPPPTAPTSLVAMAAGSARIDLSWTNTSTTQTGVKIERSTDGATFTQIALAGATAASYSDIGLSASTTYFYRVRATNASGDSADSNTASATTEAAPPTGQWSARLAWPLVAVHMTLLPTGKVLTWDDHTDGDGADVFDPATNALTAVPFSAANLFCSGHALLRDGRVFVAGGHSGTTHIGITNATIFDPASQGWSSMAPLPEGRWYPTVTALPGGRMLITAGEIDCDGCNALIPVIYDPATNSWTQLTNASQSLPYYPHMFVLPDGRVLAASANRGPMASVALDTGSQTWTTVDPAVLDGGSAATYAPGKIIKSGLGRDPDLPGAPSVPTTYVIDMSQASPAWRQTASMAFPRTEHNLTLLPDGTVLATGGSRNSDVGDTAAAVLEAELWSPTTETWTTMAAMQTPRMYHSTALLLPDGRVLVAGGGRDFPEVDQPSAEIYAPPYLFKGPRPAIASAPTSIQYATAFFVGTPDGARIAAVSLVRLGAVTHAFNQNQRFVPLTFQPSAGGLTIQAPGTANLAPPGHYMLFIVDSNGVPSVAAMVGLG